MASNPPPPVDWSGNEVFPSPSLPSPGQTSSRSSTGTERLDRGLNASMASSHQPQHGEPNSERHGSTLGQHPLHDHDDPPDHPPRPPSNGHHDDSAHSPPSMRMPPPPSPLPEPNLPNDLFMPSTHKWHDIPHLLSEFTEEFFRQLYFNLHLRLPSHYFSRVAMIFENAALTRGELRDMIREAKGGGRPGLRTRAGGFMTSDHLIRPRSAYEKIESSWNTLIESLLREWETLNVVSVLLPSAILTILQIDDAASYSVTRYTAFASLVCALMSLLYGCLFIARFASMKDTTRSVRWASEWAEEASRYRLPILWNVWVMLALPSTFLCWAIAFFVACIMSFMWHSALQVPDSSTSASSSSSSPSNTISLRTGRIFCTIITIILFIGLVYLALIITTFKKWGTRVRVWTEDYNQAIGLSDPSFPILDLHRNQWESEGEGNDDDSGVASVGRGSGIRMPVAETATQGPGSGLRERHSDEPHQQNTLPLPHGNLDDAGSLDEQYRIQPPLASTHSTVDMRMQS